MKKRMTEEEKAMFDLRLRLQRIQSSVLRLEESRVNRFVGSYENSVMCFIFVKDYFINRITELITRLPFGSRETLTAALFVKSRIWESGQRKYYVIRESDEEFKFSDIWTLVGDILVMVLNDPNIDRKITDELFFDFPSNYGYASRGMDGGFRIEVFDISDPIINELQSVGDRWFATHDCWKEMAVHAPYAEQVKFMGISEYNFDCQEDYNIRIEVRLGKSCQCNKCGDRIYFCRLSPSMLSRHWRMKILGHKE